MPEDKELMRKYKQKYDKKRAKNYKQISCRIDNKTAEDFKVKIAKDTNYESVQDFFKRKIDEYLKN